MDNEVTNIPEGEIVQNFNFKRNIILEKYLVPHLESILSDAINKQLQRALKDKKEVLE